MSKRYREAKVRCYGTGENGPFAELDDGRRVYGLTAAAPHLLAALKDLVGDMPDMRWQGTVAICRHCGRTYQDYDDAPAPKDATECSDDCPGYIARAAIVKAEGQP